MPESGGVSVLENKTKLGDIFLTMSYNETELENFSTILSWLSERGNVLTSILNGNWLESTSPKNDFLIGQKPVSISYLDIDKLEKHLKLNLIEGKLSPEPPIDENELKERIRKFQKLIEEKAVPLSIAESVATQTPLWQIREYDLPTWTHQINSSNNITSQGILEIGLKVGLISLSFQNYSIKNILTLLSVLIQSDAKFGLLVGSCSDISHDVAYFLPTVYIIDALNKSKIRKAPIDLFLLDRSSTENIQFLEREAKSSQVFLWGSFHKYSTGIFSGVMFPNSPVRAAHFILDSSADVETAVDSIASEVWCSGSNVNGRARSLLFVHQPMHNNVRQLLEKRMNLLKTTRNPSLKSSDFIRRTQVSIDSGTARAVKVEKTKAHQLKDFPEETDFSLPTLLSEVGTSCDLIASRSSGLGHLLFVIPYRSPSELLVLANNYGDENQVFIHATDLALVKYLVTNIKGATLRVNSSYPLAVSSPDQDLNRLAIMAKPGTPFIGNIDILNDEFVKAVTVAEKSLKSWESTGMEIRHSMGARVFLLATMGDQSHADLDSLRYLTDFMKVAGRIFKEDDVKNTGNLMMYHFKPYGVAGLILLNPEKMTKTASIVPILLLILKGNVSIVVSVLQVESPLLASLVSACNSVLPPGVVQFIRSPSLPQAVHSLSRQGKVPLLWIVHAGLTLPRVDDIPNNSFSKVIVDNVTCLEKSIPSRSKELEISKIIYF